MQLLSWNVNGIRAAQRKGFLKWLDSVPGDIVALQETKAHAYQLDDALKNVDGYHVYFSKPEKKGYSGVALYTKIEPISVNYDLGMEKFDREGRVIEAEFADFTLFNVYFPNGQMSQERLDYKMEFYDVFLNYIENLRQAGKNIIVCGDVNTAHQEIDLARPKENSKISGFLPIERAWLDKWVATGYVDTFRHFHGDEVGKYSWWSVRTAARERNVGWRIDYFFVNEAFLPHVEDAYILADVMGSDHCPIGINLKF